MSPFNSLGSLSCESISSQLSVTEVSQSEALPESVSLSSLVPSPFDGTVCTRASLVPEESALGDEGTSEWAKSTVPESTSSSQAGESLPLATTDPSLSASSVKSMQLLDSGSGPEPV